MERTKTRKEMCEYFKVTRQTLYNWQKSGMPCERLGKLLLRYNIEEVREWLKSRAE